MDKDFTQILQEFLKENNLSRSDFARVIGVQPSQVSEWLKGKAKPGYDMLKRMSSRFNVTANYFLGLTDDY